MTVPTPCEHDEDITKDAIDQIFLQPVETLEMLMNSFSTDPTCKYRMFISILSSIYIL